MHGSSVFPGSAAFKDLFYIPETVLDVLLRQLCFENWTCPLPFNQLFEWLKVSYNVSAQNVG
jgi:hypothetical protein